MLKNGSNEKNKGTPIAKYPHWSKSHCLGLVYKLLDFALCEMIHRIKPLSTMLLEEKKKGKSQKKVEVQTPSVTYCQRMSRETTRARATEVMLQGYDFRDDFSVIKSLTEGNKNPSVPSAAENLKPCSHLFIISERARSQRHSPMAISVLSWFKLLAYTPRSTDLPKLFLESEMERALRFGLVDGKWDLVRYQLVVLWSILAVTWGWCTWTCGVKMLYQPRYWPPIPIPIAIPAGLIACCEKRPLSENASLSSCSSPAAGRRWVYWFLPVIAWYRAIQFSTTCRDSNFRAWTGTLYGLCFTRRPARPISSRRRQMVLALRWLFTQVVLAFPRYHPPPPLRASQPQKVHSTSGERVKRGRKCLANRKSSISSKGRIHYPPVPAYFSRYNIIALKKVALGAENELFFGKI